MKALLQRVKSASVSVENEVIGRIGRGVLIFLGVGRDDQPEQVDYLVNKILNLRIFENEANKFDQSLLDIEGEVLVVSQFTLCGTCEKGRRPDFFSAAAPFLAKKLYDDFIEKIRQAGIKTETGKFGAKMQVDIENDGPVTFLLEK